MALLHMKKISKSFFGVEVLHSVHLDVEKGTVHALLGENGAGKSTLMDILTGVYTRDSGKVYFDGQELENTTVKKSEAAGIAFVHQELNLFNELKVYENIFLNKERVHKGIILNEHYLTSNLDEIGGVMSIFSAYPDLYLDLIKPQDSSFTLFFY